MTVPEPNEFRQLDTFPRLRKCTPKLPCILHPHCFFIVDVHPWLFLRLQLLHTLFASLIVLLLPFSVSVVLCLPLYRVFCLSILAKLSTPIFPWGSFLYSGFNFSHYKLKFPTCYCIPYVRSGLYQLVIRVKGFRVCALHSVRVPLRPRK